MRRQSIFSANVGAQRRNNRPDVVNAQKSETQNPIWSFYACHGSLNRGPINPAMTDEKDPVNHKNI
jgi:hypothetical protein